MFLSYSYNLFCLWKPNFQFQVLAVCCHWTLHQDLGPREHEHGWGTLPWSSRQCSFRPSPVPFHSQVRWWTDLVCQILQQHHPLSGRCPWCLASKWFGWLAIKEESLSSFVDPNSFYCSLGGSLPAQINQFQTPNLFYFVSRYETICRTGILVQKVC